MDHALLPCGQMQAVAGGLFACCSRQSPPVGVGSGSEVCHPDLITVPEPGPVVTLLRPSLFALPAQPHSVLPSGWASHLLRALQWLLVFPTAQPPWSPPLLMVSSSHTGLGQRPPALSIVPRGFWVGAGSLLACSLIMMTYLSLSAHALKSWHAQHTADAQQRLTGLISLAAYAKVGFSPPGSSGKCLRLPGVVY